MGGMLKAISAGYPQSQIAESAYRIQQMIETGEMVKVGVNMYYEPDWVGTTEVFRVKPEVRDTVMERLKRYRSERDEMKVRDSLNELRRMAENNDVNLFPYMYNAIKAGATVGETSKTLREIWGEYKEPIIF